MLKILFVFIALLSTSSSLISQDYTQFWLRLHFQKQFSKQVSSTLEFHHRTQSLKNTESPFRYPLTNAFRLWIQYKVDKNQTINFSPYAFFSNYPTMSADADQSKSNTNEHRVQIQYEANFKLNQKIKWTNRIGAEYRFFEGNNDLFRIRIREGISTPLNNQMVIQVYDEIFINTLHIDNTHIFDQNRIGIQINNKINSKLHLDIGTNLIHSLPRKNNEITINWMFFTTASYSL